MDCTALVAKVKENVLDKLFSLFELLKYLSCPQPISQCRQSRGFLLQKSTSYLKHFSKDHRFKMCSPVLHLSFEFRSCYHQPNRDASLVYNTCQNYRNVEFLANLPFSRPWLSLSSNAWHPGNLIINGDTFTLTQ